MDPVVKEYASNARVYDRKWSFYVESSTSQTIARLGMGPNDRVLDVGCGTGELLSRLAAKYPHARLAGLDPVPEMLEIARAKLSDKADLQVGWANALPWPDASFDVVVSCNMFHYITHPEVSVREMKRVLAPGGRLLITDWCDDYLMCRLCTAYLRFMSKAHFKTYREDECAALLREAGDLEPKIDRYKISWLWGLMTAVAQKAA
jgi:ubiquinone/menaquinone biosynthesis C-methylase UbiE